MELQTIIFDADHTLYTPQSDAAYDAKFRFLADETRADQGSIRRAWEERTEAQLQTDDPDVWERKQMIEETLQNVGVTPDDAIVAEAYNLFWETVVDNTAAAANVNTLLRNLRSAGYNLAIATDEFPEPLRMKLATVIEDTNVDAFFDMIVTAQDTGEQKPSEAFYTPIIDRFGGIADEYMMVGDSWVRDLQPAQELGLRTVLVGDSDPPGSPDHHIDRLAELDDIVAEVADR